MPDFNGEWFRKKLVQKQRSQRGLARHLGVDASAVTLMFDGRRRMQLSEAEQIAAFLGEPLNDVLRAAGLPIKQSRTYRIVGYIDDCSRIEEEDLGSIEGPASMPEGTVVLRIKGWQGFNGGLLFYKPK